MPFDALPPGWRPMLAQDLVAVDALGSELHPSYPETFDVLADKFACFARGCFILENATEVAGYCVSHPWRGRYPPALNARLGSLPALPDEYFLHDIALRPEARGRGAIAGVLALAGGVAAELGLARLRMVSVNGTERVWSRYGFVPVMEGDVQRYVRGVYGAEAVAMERSSVEANDLTGYYPRAAFTQ